MFNKFVIGCVLAALTIGFVPLTAASASPPERFEVPDYFSLNLDADEGKSVWFNITAVNFCTWALGGFDGPAPVEDTSTPVMLIHAGQDGGTLVASVQADVYVEVWNLDNPDTAGIGPCEDILDQLLAGGQPWATGTASLNGRTNNLFWLDDVRSASDNLSASASIVTAEGESYDYKLNFHVGNRCADYRCEIANSTLRVS